LRTPELEDIVRVSFIEGLCLVAIGFAMVELHDSQRAGRAGLQPGAALAMAAKPAAVAGTPSPQQALDLRPGGRER